MNFNSADAVASAASRDCAAPITTKLVHGKVWNVAPALRSGL
ncbi:hypothetical protein [Tardiphaga sp. 37S4]